MPPYLYVCAVIRTALYAQGLIDYFLLVGPIKLLFWILWLGSLSYCATTGMLILWNHQMLHARMRRRLEEVLEAVIGVNNTN